MEKQSIQTKTQKQSTINLLTPEKISYKQFIQLKEKYQSFYLYNLKFMKDSDLLYPIKDYIGKLDISSLTFREVKEFMDAVNNQEELWNLITSYEDYKIDNIINLPAYKVLYTFNKIQNDIVDLMQYEAELLQSKTPSTYSAETDMVDFSMFNSYFIQRDSLAKGDITKYKEVDSIPYKTAFLKLLFDTKNSDLEKMILKKKV